MRRLRHPPLRVRLAAAFAGVTAVLLAAVGTYIFLETKHGLDASLDATLRADAAALADRPDGSLRAALRVEGDPAQLLAADGTVLASSPSAPATPLANAAHLREALRGEARWERHEVYRRLGRPAGDGRAIVVQASMAQRERALDTLGGVLLVGGPLILIISSFCGYLVAAGALRPVERLRGQSAAISSASSAVRLSVPEADDELRRLATTLNGMLGRLAAADAAQRRFLANASHELRTPLAILKAEVDLALDGPPVAAELQAALRSVGEEADRLDRLASDLLVLARADDGALRLRLEPVDLGALAQELAQRLRSLADVAVEAPEGVVVAADRLHLERALVNLVRNAALHGAPPVTLTVRRHGDAAVRLLVHDAGAGVPAEVGDRAFDRLVTGAGSRGAGLGLPLVAAIAAAHGGTAGLEHDGSGTTAWVELPYPGEPSSRSSVRGFAGQAASTTSRGTDRAA